MRYNRDFARSRRVPNAYLVDADGRSRMNRLWIAESTFSHTGAMADHRLPLRAEHGLPFAMALGAALGVGAPPASELVKEPKVQAFVRVLAEELQQNRGRAVVIAGRRQPPEVHALVARINQQLDAVGKTLEYLEDPELDRQSHVKSLQALALEMSAGKVGALVILGGNPVYDAPADLEFATALAKVKTSIHLSEFVNETSLKATWHLPRAHFLEAWGDTRTWDGTVAITQPLIAPLYGGISAIELLSMLAGEEQAGEQLVRGDARGARLRQLAPVRPRRPRPGHAVPGRAGAGRQLPAAAAHARPGRRQLDQQRQARGGVPLLELHVRRPVREQRVAPGDAGLPVEGHVGQLRDRRARDRRGARDRQRHPDPRQDRHRRGHARLLHDAGPGQGLDRARRRRRPHRRRPGRQQRRR